MKPFSLIVAVSENEVIGHQGRLPWHLPRDLSFFRRVTWGGILVMGRRTYESLPKPLPRRILWVLSRSQPKLPHAQVFPSWEAMLAHAYHEARSIFFIGGREVFLQALSLPYLSIYLTRVHGIFEGDTFLSLSDLQALALHEKIFFPADDRNPYPCTFEFRKKN
ncbi:MAG: dihydrofolate reductase [Bacteroidia bacterium]